MDQNANAGQEVMWVGPEFIHHHKSLAWYMGLGAVTAVLAGMAYFATSGSLFTVVAITVAVLSLAMFASRKPQDYPFSVDYEGIHVGERLYPFDQFESFSMVMDGDVESVYLTSTNRLQMPLSLYIPEDKIDLALQIVESMVPYKEKQQTAVEQLMHSLRF